MTLVTHNLTCTCYYYFSVGTTKKYMSEAKLGANHIVWLLQHQNGNSNIHVNLPLTHF